MQNHDKNIPKARDFFTNNSGGYGKAVKLLNLIDC
jgi:hypothetical protein